MLSEIRSPENLRASRSVVVDAAPSGVRCIVAVPARNEARSIARTLARLQGVEGLGIVVLVNNSSDGTFDEAVASARKHGLRARIVSAALAPPHDNAGGARRIALDIAADWLRRDSGAGALLTTDADTEVPADWVRDNLRALEKGADCIAGDFVLKPDSARRLPPGVKARMALERRYDRLLTELFSRLDPSPHDPWPRHACEAGASLACRLSAYEAIGGLPRVPFGEDRALCRQMRNGGFLVRHDPAIVVSTSARLHGRAAGGMAETLRYRARHPDSPCDDYLEPFIDAFRRGLLRGRAHRAFAREGGEAFLSLGARCGEAALAACRNSRTFDAGWQTLEDECAELARRPLRPRELPCEISKAERFLDLVRGAEDRGDSRRSRATSQSAPPALRR